MKSKLLLLTLFAAFAGAATAQSNVTIYGVADAGITVENNGGAVGSVTRLDSGILNGSRLGFKGVEDLGDGLSALFTLEMGINIDDGTAAQGGLGFGRQSWVGLAGKFGAVKLGRQFSPVYANVSTFDPFANGLAGDSARLFNFSGSRINNAVTYGYETNGFRGQLIYGMGEVPGNTSASRTVGGFAGYKKGPIDAVLATTTIADRTGSVHAKTTLLGGNYDFGSATVYVAYAWNKDATAAGAPSAGANTRDALIGVAMPIGAGSIRTSYIRKSDRALGNANAHQFAAGYVYNLSKRTALYTSYGRLANDGAATYKAGALGATDKLFDVGMRHTF